MLRIGARRHKSQKAVPLLILLILLIFSVCVRPLWSLLREAGLPNSPGHVHLEGWFGGVFACLESSPSIGNRNAEGGDEIDRTVLVPLHTRGVARGYLLGLSLVIARVISKVAPRVNRHSQLVACRTFFARSATCISAAPLTPQRVK